MSSVQRHIKGTVIWISAILGACGEKNAYDQGTELEAAVLGSGGGGSRTETEAIIITTPPAEIRMCTVTKRRKVEKPPEVAPTYTIANVTQIVEATSGISDWLAAELPFTGPSVAIGQPVTNGQTPFMFTFDYPQNNYQFVEAHLVIDTARDSSDTEGIFVDGVFSGRPPLDNVNQTTAKTTDKIYYGSGASTINTSFIDWSLSHYKIATRNSFDLLLSDLLVGSSNDSISALEDGRLNVVTGDDSPVYQAYLVIRGRTIADSALACEQSPTYTFTNRYLHNDGNTIGSATFDGTVGTSRESWLNAIGTYGSVEFYFDAPLPKVDIENIDVTQADLNLRLKRNSTGKAAIVINGVGVAETGFDRSTATDAVERWDDDAVAAFETFLATVPTTGADTTTTLNLLSLFPADDVRALLQQGKLNVSFAGSQIFFASGLTSARGFAAPINGPELSLAGTYSTEVCDVPNNPNSALTQNGIVPVEEPEVEEYEDYTVEEPCDGSSSGSDESEDEGTIEVANDGAGPVISSLQATEITSTKATILWLTDEAATAQVSYGVGSLTQTTALNSTPTTYHVFELTGLSPYKYYKYQVTTTDKYGNSSTSDILVFTTLR